MRRKEKQNNPIFKSPQPPLLSPPPFIPPPSRGRGRGEGPLQGGQGGIFALVLSFYFLLSIFHSSLSKAQTLQNSNDQIKKEASTQPAFFVMGIQAYKEGRYADALDHLQKAHAEPSFLGEYIRYWIGRTLNALNRPTEALATLPLIAKIERKIEENIFWERIESLILLKQWAKVETLINRRKKETAKDKLAQIKNKFHKGRIAALQGKTALSRQIWRDLLVESASNPFEEEILGILKRENTSLAQFLSDGDWLKRAQSLIEAGNPLEALPVYNHLHRTTGRNFSFDIAKANFKARQYARAASLFQELWDNPKPGQDRADILSMLATSYGRSDQFEEALKYNRKIIDLYSNSNLGRITRYKIAFIHLDAGQYSRAEQAFTEYLSGKHPYRRKEAIWNRLWAVYLTGNYSKTLIELESLEKKERDKDELLKIAYWKARCMEQINNGSAARLIYEDIRRQKPTHYYGFLSAQKLAGRKIDPMELVDPASIPSPLIPPPLGGTTPCRHGMGGRGEGTYQADSWREKIPLDDPLLTAVQLAEIGLSEYAYDEAERSPLLKGGLPPDLLAQALTVAQNFKQISALGRACLRTGLAPPRWEEAMCWTMSYPRAYLQWVNLFSEKYLLDRYLAWSVMREESAFRPSVVSKAYAIGLMQMIPQTGKEVASLLGKTDFHPENLKDPMTNIEFGILYLKNRMEEFGGNMIYTLASYNAGPDAVNRWRKWGDTLAPDEFIELIPYDETRDYVKKVMTSYWIYRGLYSN